MRVPLKVFASGNQNDIYLQESAEHKMQCKISTIQKQDETNKADVLLYCYTVVI